MNKIFIVGVLALLVCGVGILYDSINSDTHIKQERLYQGPVPLDYDLEHFRNTGETIPMEVNS